MRQLGVLVIAGLLASSSGLIGSEREAAASSQRSAKQAKKAKQAKQAKATKKKAKRTARARGKRGKRGKKSYFSGHGVGPDALRKEPLARPSGKLWVYSENFREEAEVQIYRADGSYDDAALAKLDQIFRCKRTGEVRAVDPRLYETLSVISDHFAGKRVDLVSGFRFQRDEGSRHYHASAMDIRLAGVSDRELYQFAESLDPGGMGIGIYPRSGFVHVDYRAPGEPSYRWTDRSPPDGDAPNKRASRRVRPKS